MLLLRCDFESAQRAVHHCRRRRRVVAVLLPALLTWLSCSEESDTDSNDGTGGSAMGAAAAAGASADGVTGAAASSSGSSAGGSSGSSGSGGSATGGSAGSSGSGGSATGGSTGSSSSGGSATGGSAGSSGSGGSATGGSTGSSSSGGSATGGSAGSSGSGGSATGGSTSSGGAATGGAGTAGETGSGGSAGEGGAALYWVGRVDQSDPADVRCAWSGCGVIAQFESTSASVELGDTQEYTVVVDGTVRTKLVASRGTNVLAENLTPGIHVVELYRRTEASEGESRFLSFDFGSGTLLAPPRAPTRRIEIIGDSISCGYGNEGEDQYCSFSADTENHYLTYGAIAARNLGAELSTVAWSGKGVVCNYGDDANSCTDAFPVYYERTLPDRQDSQWDFSTWQADAVVINLGTNDFSTDSDPSQTDFEGAYQDLIENIRTQYPNAFILCTVGPLLSGTDLSTVRGYIENVVGAVNTGGDERVDVFELAPTDDSDGYGCDWHPSLASHEKMADELTAVLESTLGW